MDERSVFDLTPQMSRASQELFGRYRLLLMVGLLIAMLAAPAGNIVEGTLVKVMPVAGAAQGK